MRLNLPLPPPTPAEKMGVDAHYEFIEVWQVMQFFAGTLIWFHTNAHTHSDAKAHGTIRGQ